MEKRISEKQSEPEAGITDAKGDIMSEQVSSDNVNDGQPVNLEQLKANADKAEAELKAKFNKPEVTTAPVGVQKEVKAPDSSGKSDVPPQFRKSDGSLDEQKLAQSQQNLEEKLRKQKEALELYKSKQREMTQVSESLKQAKASIQPEPIIVGDNDPLVDSYSNDLGLDKETAKKLVALNRKTAAEENKKILEMINQEKAAKVELERAKALDEYTKANPSVLEGDTMDKVMKVLEERPYLYQSKNPLEDALAFVTNSNFQKAQTPGDAQVRLGTPILGAGSAVLPPSSLPPVSEEQQLENLKVEIDFLMGVNQEKAKQKMAEYDVLMAKRLSQRGLKRSY